jgi:type IV pilus assembly protein PilC
MLFSRRLSTKTVIQLCRVLRHNLSAGLMLRDIFRQQAKRGPVELRPVALRITTAIERGDSLKVALNEEKHAFPPLFLALAGVGEHTGFLPEIFGELESYYLMQQKFWRQFITQSIAPVLQFVAAILVITGLIYILGIIAESNHTKPLDPLGFGLVGTTGAMIFFFSAFGSIAAVIAAYFIASYILHKKSYVDGLLLRIPAVGPFLKALALARFTLALHLTLDSATPIRQALELSLRATDNGAFIAAYPVIDQTLLDGENVTQALGRSRLFDEDFMNVVAVGEESGRLPEVMGQQAEQYEEEAGRRLAVLTKVAGFAVWLMVAILIIFAIFRIFMLYLGALQGQGLGL